MIQLAQKYNPQEVENGKYDSWLKESYFTAGDILHGRRIFGCLPPSSRPRAPAAPLAFYSP